MNENLRVHLHRFTRNQLVDILYASLAEMQLNNGQTCDHAVLEAIGAEKTETGWRIPCMNDVIKNTEGAASL